MNLVHIFKRTEKFALDNAPLILTAFGVTGTVTTAYLTGKASIKAAEIVRREDLKIRAANEKPLERKEKFQLVWQLYIPPVATGTATIAAIITANRVGTRRAAAMAAAYSISEKAFSEYKEKVIEKIGENKERAIRDEIVKDRINDQPVSESRVIITDNGKHLCYDMFTGRYFLSNMETLRKAENDINFKILHEDYANVSDFYELIGLPATSMSQELGWNTDYKMEIVYSTQLSDDNRPCIAIDFDVHPQRKYAHYAE